MVQADRRRFGKTNNKGTRGLFPFNATISGKESPPGGGSHGGVRRGVGEGRLWRVPRAEPAGSLCRASRAPSRRRSGATLVRAPRRAGTGPRPYREGTPRRSSLVLNTEIAASACGLLAMTALRHCEERSDEAVSSRASSKSCSMKAGKRIHREDGRRRAMTDESALDPRGSDL